MTLMPAQPIRVYADTSVYGGVFDEEFAEASRVFFDEVSAGTYRLVTSPLLREELAQAPDHVQQWYDRFSSTSEQVELSEPLVLPHQAEVSAGIVARKWEADALHV